MNRLKRTLPQLALLLAAGWVAVAQAQAAEDEHAAHMRHSAETTDMEGMDHSQMDHSGHEAGASGLAHEHDVVPMGAGSLRDPYAYADGYGFGEMQHRMPGADYLASLRVNRLEAVHTGDQSASAFDLQGWLGRDYDRLAVKAEGEHADGALQDVRSELLWWHAVASFWNTQLGVRHDSGEWSSRNWLAAGIEGVAPYWFELDATAYVGEAGRTALRLGAEYELLFTQRLILQPRLEVNWYGQEDVERGQGAGLNNMAVGLRLRYEIRRELAPYVGVEWTGKFGSTADLALKAGEKTSTVAAVAGIRFWF